MDDTQVLEMIKRLKLFGMAETLMTRLEQAKANKLSYEAMVRTLSSGYNPVSSKVVK